MRYTRFIIIVPKGAQAAANAAARHWDEDDAGDTFTTRLSPSGSLPATHYAASGVLTARRMLRLRDKLQGLPAAIKWTILKTSDPQGRVADGNLGFAANSACDFDRVLTATGLKPVEEP